MVLWGGVVALPAAKQAPLRAAPTAVVTVQVIGLRNDRGVIKAALFSAADAWARDRANQGVGALQRQDAPIRSGVAQLSFSGLAYGSYAIKAFHDEDGSGKFYTGLFGIPKVEVAFSNNPPISKGPAPFQAARFTVNQPYTSLVLRAQRL